MTDTVPLVYDEEGTGPLLVAVHGMTEDRHVWDRVPLAERFRTIRVDLRGHGQSPRVPPYDARTLAADVHALVATLAPQEQPLLVGHSLGGVVVTAYASRHPVRGVVIIDQALDVAPLNAEFAEAVRGEGFEAFMTAAFARMYGELDPRIAEDLQARRSLRQDVLLGAWEPLLTLDADSLDRWMDDIVRPARSRPYLSLHGLHHSADYATWLGERIPGAHVEAAPIATHYPHLADPVWFLDRLIAFDASIPATPSR
jgi:pimeloyl-ACP methyl ester carboxylesterase